MDEATPLSNHYAIYDLLSGALSRRAFLEEAVSEFRKFQRYKHPFAFLIVDIDHFQQYNQRYSIEEGDRTLKQLVTILLQSLREQDHVGRLGGDEFGVLLLETDEDGARKTALRLCQNCSIVGLFGDSENQEQVEDQQQKIPTLSELHLNSPDSGAALPLTVSIGVSMPLDQDQSFEQVFTRADRALNLAKQNGGNRVEYLFG
ncbi:MAG: GGDEF domain-containing protein [Anaerolineales bacterium]